MASLFHTIFSLSFGILYCFGSNPDSSLKFVQVLFRHGERTVDPTTTYPNDPYINETYYPYGYNELTKKGKKTMFDLGHELRERYDEFLGLYYPDIVLATSSYYNRSKASLALVLAGLFPPSELIVPGLNWQPIPYNYIPLEEDDIFLTFLTCQPHKLELQRYKLTAKYQNLVKPDLEAIRDISKSTGTTFLGYDDVVILQSCLKSQLEFGLPLPKWAQPYYPHRFEQFYYNAMKLYVATPKLTKLYLGQFFKRIINEAMAQMTGAIAPKNVRMALYSIHDVTMAPFLAVFNLFRLPPIDYGAMILLEWHNISNVYGLKMYSRNTFNETLQLLTIPGCGEFCPIRDFVEITKEFIPVAPMCDLKGK